MNASSHFSLLVVDDEPDLRTLYELTLLREGYEIETAGSVEDAWAHLKDRAFSAVITDMRLPDGTGLDLLRRLETQGRREKAIVITAFGSSENAVEALKAGAFDYLTKPVDLRQFRAVVASALGRTAMAVPTMVPSSLPSEHRAAPSEAAALVPAAAAPPVVVPVSASTSLTAATGGPVSVAFARMVGQSSAIQQVRALVEKVARSMAPVLINGESGTGKELVAKSIHEVSTRGNHPFIAVNCSAIPEQLLEAEFFGYRKGSFTGANEDREGFFQAANGGTLFLDEIGDLPLSMQSKLLRSIQERAVRPVGAVAELPVNVRLLSATHKDLAAEVQSGHFRQDLYYRLNVIQIRVPPLRERAEDLAEISAQILLRLSKDAGMQPVPRLTRDALVHLARYPFPGNVRELENLLHRAVALTGGQEINVFDLGLPETVFTDSAAQELDLITRNTPVDVSVLMPPPLIAAPPVEAPLPNDLEAHLDQVEREILLRALERYRNNRTAAGASMGLSLRQMRYRMARLNVTVGGEAGMDADAERGGGSGQSLL
ncbi:MAG: sigma-54 dependent transcriptional regulator [Pseudomonadota bacterium]